MNTYENITLDKNHLIGSSLSDFIFISELGRGSYGIVSKVHSLIDKNTYVIKKIDLRNIKAERHQDAINEVNILKKLIHPNIIKYYSSFIENDCLFIVMEYAESGDLHYLIRDCIKKKRFLSEDVIWRYSYEILLAINYLHSMGIIHRDIKCLNIYLKNGMIKVGDLGVSKIYNNSELLAFSKVGTPSYLSPELIKESFYDYKVDIWAVGCCVYFLAKREPPFKGETLEILGDKIVNETHSFIKNYSVNLNNFIDRLLNKKPENRVSSQLAIEMIPDHIKSDYNSKIKKLNDLERIKDQFDYNQILGINNKTDLSTSKNTSQNFVINENVKLYDSQTSSNQITKSNLFCESQETKKDDPENKFEDSNHLLKESKEKKSFSHKNVLRFTKNMIFSSKPLSKRLSINPRTGKHNIPMFTNTGFKFEKNIENKVDFGSTNGIFRASTTQLSKSNLIIENNKSNEIEPDDLRKNIIKSVKDTLPFHKIKEEHSPTINVMKMNIYNLNNVKDKTETNKKSIFPAIQIRNQDIMKSCDGRSSSVLQRSHQQFYKGNNKLFNGKKPSMNSNNEFTFAKILKKINDEKRITIKDFH